jgi:hypothetical protein
MQADLKEFKEFINTLTINRIQDPEMRDIFHRLYQGIMTNFYIARADLDLVGSRDLAAGGGAGVSMVAPDQGINDAVKNIEAGVGITIDDFSNHICINAAGGGPLTDAGAGLTLIKSAENPYEIRKLQGGGGILLESQADELKISAGISWGLGGTTSYIDIIGTEQLPVPVWVSGATQGNPLVSPGSRIVHYRITGFQFTPTITTASTTVIELPEILFENYYEVVGAPTTGLRTIWWNGYYSTGGNPSIFRYGFDLQTGVFQILIPTSVFMGTTVAINDLYFSYPY